MLNVFLIFSLLKREKVLFIDTAYTYKNAQKYLGKHNIKNFKIISKLPKFKRVNLNILEEEVINHIKQSLKKLNISRFYALLIHDTKELDSNKGKKIFKVLQLLKKRNMVNSIILEQHRRLKQSALVLIQMELYSALKKKGININNHLLHQYFF